MASKRMEEVLKQCKRENIDRDRLASFCPKNRQEILKLPVYSIKEIDLLHSMLNAEYEHHPLWFSEWKQVNSCFSLYQKLDTNNLGDDIIEVLEKPFDELPLLVNEIEPRLNLFVRWRLKIGK